MSDKRTLRELYRDMEEGDLVTSLAVIQRHLDTQKKRQTSAIRVLGSESNPRRKRAVRGRRQRKLNGPRRVTIALHAF